MVAEGTRYEIIDLNWLDGLLHNNESFASELLELFEEQIKVISPLLKRAINGDVDAQLLSLVHKLKGSSASLGLPSVATTCGLLDQSLRKERLSHVQDMATNLQRGLLQGVKELKAYVANMSK